MDDGERVRNLDAARVLEKHGNVEGAVEMYVRGGAPDEAARLLSSGRRYLDAARVLVDALGVTPRQAGTLQGPDRKRALMAAILLGRGNEVKRAVELFLALGERGRAIELLEKAGDTVAAARLRTREGKHTGMGSEVRPTAVGGVALNLQAARRMEQAGKLDAALQAYTQLKQMGDAGRVAAKLGRHEEAGELFAEAGMAYDAAQSYRELGDTGKALDNLVRVQKGDPNYRASCVEAVRMSASLQSVGFALENLLVRFIAEGPRDGRELEAFYLLAKLYEQHDFLENAKEVLRRIVDVQPGYRDVAARLQSIEQQTEGSDLQFQQVLRQDASFARDGRDQRQRSAAAADELPGLPELPDLPPLPPPAPNVPSAAMAPNAPHAVGSPGAPVGATLFEVRAPAAQGSVAAVPAAVVPAPGIAPDVPLQAAPPVQGQPAQAPPGPAPIPLRHAVSDGPAFAVGGVVADRWRIEQQIGQGGMATVFRAVDQELGEEVALKVFSQALEDESALQRFRQELKLSRQLSHPNVVRLFDIGVYRGHRFISMELLRGGDLKSKLGAPLPLDRGIRYLQQACAGLEAAHRLGIIHRDIKPENFFVTSEDRLKVMDFGIAKQQRTAGITVAGMVAGTPEYMAPEQISDFTSVTPRTDLYALGVVAFEMFTGRLPFQHPELMPLLMMHLQQEPPSPRSVAPSLPASLETVILRALSKKPDDRYASCLELAGALEQVRLDVA